MMTSSHFSSGFYMARYIGILHVLRKWFRGHRLGGSMTGTRVTAIPILMYMAGGILSREPGGDWQEKTLEIMARNDDLFDDENQMLTPHEARGCLFWVGWRQGVDLIATTGQQLPIQLLLRAFGKFALDGQVLGVWQELLRGWGSHTENSDPGGWNVSSFSDNKRVGNKSRNMTKDYFWEYPNYDDAPLPPSFQFNTVKEILRGVRIDHVPLISHDDNPDVQPEDWEDPNEWPRPNRPTAAQRLEDVLRQFFCGVFATSPRPHFKNGRRNVVLWYNSIAEATPAVFATPDLSRRLTGAYVRFLDDEDYASHALKFFPLHAPDYKIQGITRSAFIRLWARLIAQVGDKNTALLQKGIFLLLRGTVWLPSPGSDRLWRSGYKVPQDHGLRIGTEQVRSRPDLLDRSRGWIIVRKGFIDSLNVGTEHELTEREDQHSERRQNGDPFGASDHGGNDDDDSEDDLYKDGQDIPIPQEWDAAAINFDDAASVTLSDSSGLDANTHAVIRRLINREPINRAVFEDLQLTMKDIPIPPKAKKQASLQSFFGPARGTSKSQSATPRSQRSLVYSSPAVTATVPQREGKGKEVAGGHGWTQGSAEAGSSQPRPLPPLTPQMNPKEAKVLHILDRFLTSNVTLAWASDRLEREGGTEWIHVHPHWHRAMRIAEEPDPSLTIQETSQQIRHELISHMPPPPPPPQVPAQMASVPPRPSRIPPTPAASLTPPLPSPPQPETRPRPRPRAIGPLNHPLHPSPALNSGRREATNRTIPGARPTKEPTIEFSFISTKATNWQERHVMDIMYRLLEGDIDRAEASELIERVAGEDWEGQRKWSSWVLGLDIADSNNPDQTIEEIWAEVEDMIVGRGPSFEAAQGIYPSPSQTQQLEGVTETTSTSRRPPGGHSASVALPTPSPMQKPTPALQVVPTTPIMRHRLSGTLEDDLRLAKRPRTQGLRDIQVVSESSRSIRRAVSGIDMTRSGKTPGGTPLRSVSSASGHLRSSSLSWFMPPSSPSVTRPPSRTERAPGKSEIRALPPKWAGLSHVGTPPTADVATGSSQKAVLTRLPLLGKGSDVMPPPPPPPVSKPSVRRRSSASQAVDEHPRKRTHTTPVERKASRVQTPALSRGSVGSLDLCFRN